MEIKKEYALRGKWQRRLIRHARVPVVVPSAQFLVEDLGTDL
ncbi:protein of unknown function [Nitrospira japonica]|uniref:Uncharacterized protein n=1 Tax=Nitrospira japonica TaxID=1325564 RepID=A0A1W1I5A5_9BACT|nr:protein of unknown function [Nitrospira japonica]